MKNKILVRLTFFCLLMFSCNVKAQLVKHLAKVNKIRIEFVNYEITTPIHISCDEFKKYFGSGVTTQLITDKKKVKHICDEFSSFLKRGKTFGDPPDVRLKISFFINNKSVGTICSGLLLTSIENRSYINDEKMQLFLEKIIK